MGDICFFLFLFFYFFPSIPRLQRDWLGMVSESDVDSSDSIRPRKIGEMKYTRARGKPSWKEKRVMVTAGRGGS